MVVKFKNIVVDCEANWFSLLTEEVVIPAAVSVVTVTVIAEVYVLILAPVESCASKVSAEVGLVEDGFKNPEIENEKSCLASIVLPEAAEIVTNISLFSVLQAREVARRRIPVQVGVTGGEIVFGTFI